MKREYLLRWRITVDGPADTFRHYTFEDFRREFLGRLRGSSDAH